MMGYSSNLHHHHLEEFHWSSSFSSLAATPSFYFVGKNLHVWNQDLLFADHFIPSTNGGHDHSAPREFMRLSDHDMPMVQATDAAEEGHNKEELPEPFAELRETRELGFVDPLSSLGGIGRGRLISTVLPTANISGPDRRLRGSCSNSLGVDARAMDLSASARFGRELQRRLTVAMLKEDLAYGVGQLQEPVQPAASNGQSKTSPWVGGGTADHQQGARRADGNCLEYKASQSVAKKPRLDQSRPSFSPFKVRKEKLGDRIAALQQLVAPFGKADTASVLMEAIGYIKFLQDQIEDVKCALHEIFEH